MIAPAEAKANRLRMIDTRPCVGVGPQYCIRGSFGESLGGWAAFSVGRQTKATPSGRHSSGQRCSFQAGNEHFAVPKIRHGQTKHFKDKVG